MTLAVVLGVAFVLAFAIGLASSSESPKAAPMESAAKAKKIELSSDAPSVGALRTSSSIPALTVPKPKSRKSGNAPSTTTGSTQSTTPTSPQSAPTSPSSAPTGPPAKKPSSGNKGTPPIVSEGGGED